jgi:hypothetical protein
LNLLDFRKINTLNNNWITLVASTISCLSKEMKLSKEEAKVAKELGVEEMQMHFYE